MALYEKIESDMKNAMKVKDATKVSTLRMLMAAMKNVEIEKSLKNLEDSDVIKIIQRQVKQHKDSIEQFEKGNRADLVEKETRELKVLVSYLPEQLKEEELIKIIEEAIAKSGASTKKDAGKVMRLVMEKVKGRADGKVVNQLVMERLK